MDGEADNTGCAYNKRDVWSSTECWAPGLQVGRVVYSGSGKKAFCAAPEETKFWGSGSGIVTRCCADHPLLTPTTAPQSTTTLAACSGVAESCSILSSGKGDTCCERLVCKTGAGKGIWTGECLVPAPANGTCFVEGEICSDHTSCCSNFCDAISHLCATKISKDEGEIMPTTPPEEAAGGPNFRAGVVATQDESDTDSRFGSSIDIAALVIGAVAMVVVIVVSVGFRHRHRRLSSEPGTDVPGKQLRQHSIAGSLAGFSVGGEALYAEPESVEWMSTADRAQSKHSITSGISPMCDLIAFCLRHAFCRFVVVSVHDFPQNSKKCEDRVAANNNWIGGTS